MARNRLTPPTVAAFFVAVVLIAIGMLGYYTDALDLDTDIAFLLVSGGGILLVIASLFKGV
ncbi:MAG TPA: hypothetical protein VK960_10030 [Acidimicrobiia bacterium]|nr:hypothetical protein [Acidimicrobiia bacterium]